MRRYPVGGVLVVACAVGLVRADDAPKRLDPASLALRPETLGSKDCQRLILEMIENFIGWAQEKFADNDTYEKGGGCFQAKGSGVDWARGNSNLCVGYAVLLTAYPDRREFTMHNVPRARLEDQLRRTIRFLCLSYQGDKNPKWGPGWQVSLDFIGAAWAAHLFEKSLDQETIDLVRPVTVSVANSLDKGIPSHRFGDTGSEDCCWNAPFLAFAANKYADHPNAKKWDELCKKWALNALSRGQDKTSDVIVDGRPLKDWIVSENLHPDLTLENHGMWSVGYQVQCQFFAEGELAYRLFGRKPPEAFAFHAEEMWKKVTRALFLWDGDILYPTGQDWSWKSYSYVEYLCWLGLLRNQPEAAAYEGRALQMALKRQLAVGTGALGYSDFGNNTVKVKRGAFSYLTHKCADCPEPVSMGEAYGQSLGVHVFPHVKVAIHRAPAKCVSVSWHKAGQPIYVLPEGDSTFTDPPFFYPYSGASGGVKARLESGEEKHGGPWKDMRLLEATATHEGKGMRVCYTRRRDDGLTQFVAVISLPDEATLYVTAFRADQDSTWRIWEPFRLRASTIQGFPMRLNVHRGERWLNLSDHMGFVSSAPLPKDLSPGLFCAADERTFKIKAGVWFDPLAVVAYTRQPHEQTANLADALRVRQDEPDSRLSVQFSSSSGGTTVQLDLPR